MELVIGAPSLTGRNVNEQASAFQELKYPLKLTFKNLMPRNAVFPEIEGLFLKHVAGKPEDSQKTVLVPSYDVLQRVFSSVAQIAELNHYESAIKVLQEEEETTIQESETQTATKKKAGRPKKVADVETETKEE